MSEEGTEFKSNLVKRIFRDWGPFCKQRTGVADGVASVVMEAIATLEQKEN